MNSSLPVSSSDTVRIAAENRSIYIFVALPVLAVVTSLFVAARFYSRIFLQRQFRLDDSLIALSLLCILLNTAFQVNAAIHGVGRHNDALTIDQQIQSRFWYYISSFLSVSGLGIPKIAVVSLICRVFDPRTWHQCVLWTASIICTIQFFLATATFLMECTPYYALWDVTIKTQVCRSPWPILYFRYYATSFGASMDFYLALYPAIKFHSMGFSRRKKLALSFMLGLGVFATAVAIYKATYLKRLASPDFTWEVLDLIVWTATEGCVIVIAACVPMLHPVYEVVHAKLFDSTQRSNEPGGHNTTQAKKGFWSLMIKQAMGSRSRSSATKSSTGTRSNDGQLFWTAISSAPQASSRRERTGGAASQAVELREHDVELADRNGKGWRENA